MLASLEGKPMNDKIIYRFIKWDGCDAIFEGSNGDTKVVKKEDMSWLTFVTFKKRTNSLKQLEFVTRNGNLAFKFNYPKKKYQILIITICVFIIGCFIVWLRNC
ncbi:MAG: hypothetical protein WC889_09455 [Myxococcota bacterium]|jgi:hypothetical protein